ncbi:MAG TPA: type II toxin-antitoxin system HicB family antitoxin [Bacteriovoracaceae bacterium]|nr:type II toxin-antitoxin system HicB family antitoxin [Bacteriovoracaceae bacterium]
MKSISYQTRIYKDDDGYSVEFPDLPGCFSCGTSLGKAKMYAAEALSLFLEDFVGEMPEAKVYRGADYYLISVEIRKR